MSKTDWYTTIKNSFGSLLDFMEEMTKTEMTEKRRRNKHYISAKNFIMTLKSDGSEQAVKSMLMKFLADKKNLDLVKKGLITTGDNQKKEKGEIFNEEHEVELSITVKNDAGIEITEKCVLHNFLALICTLPTLPGREPSTKDEKETVERNTQKSNTYIHYFLASFASAISKFAVSTQFPTLDDAKIIMNANTFNIPPNPSNGNNDPIKKIVDVLESTIEDESIANLLKTFGVYNHAKTFQRATKGLQHSLGGGMASRINTVVQNKDGKAAAKLFGDITSQITKEFESTEGNVKASEQEM